MKKVPPARGARNKPRPSLSPKPTAPKVATHIPCRIWYLWDSKDPEGWAHGELGKVVALLVTEPDEIDAPIAKIDVMEGNDIAAATALAATIITNPNALVAMEAYCVDLRDVCRVNSVQKTPDHLFGFHAMPAEGTLAHELWYAFEYRPFCPIRLAQEVAKFIKLRFSSEQRAECPHPGIIISELRAQESDCGDGDCVDALIRGLDDYPYDWNLHARKALATAILPETRVRFQMPPKLVPPDGRATRGREALAGKAGA